MNRPDLFAPSSGPDPDQYKHARVWVAAFVALLISGPVVLAILLFVN